MYCCDVISDKMRLLNAINNRFMRLIFIRPSMDGEEAEKRRLFSIFTLVILIPLVVFGIVHVRQNSFLYGVMMLCVALVLVVLLVVVRHLEYGRPVYRTALSMLFLLLSCWLYFGTVGGYGSLWVLIGPLFAFFLMGRKEGIIWTMIMGTVAVVIFSNPFSLLNAFEYPSSFAIRHLSVYAILVIITYNYESLRVRYRKEMESEHAKLVHEKELLSNAKKEVDAINTLLGEEMAVRKKAEEELRRHRDDLENIVAERTEEIRKKNIELELGEKRYRLLADNVNDMIWTTDMNMVFTYISPSVSRIFGYSIDEAMALSFDRWNTPASFNKVARIYAEELERETQGTADPNRHIIARLEHYKKDDSVLDVEITVSFLRDADNKPVGLIGITRDISERVKDQKEREKIQEQLAQAQKMEAVGNLAAGIAHDFNNFLGGIIGSLDLLSRVLEKEKIGDRSSVESYLRIGMDSSRRSAELIRQLLAISKKHEVNLLPVDINVSLKHICELCKNSFPKSVDLVFKIGGEPLLIMGDHVQIDQVLLNICINASHSMTTMRTAEFRQGGTLSVEAEKIDSDHFIDEYNRDSEETGPWIRISISDTGIGMTDDIKKRIFEPFFSTNKKKGSGLGLSTSYNIVRKHGGRIHVESKPGSGSNFKVYLPAYEITTDGITESELNEDIVNGSGTVLIIDDEVSIISVVKGFLSQCGYTVLCGHGVEAGIEMFRKHHDEIAAVILDFSMPDKSGFEVFQELKTIDPGVNVILSSGMVDNDVKIQALGMGIRDIISKPFMAGELSLKVKAVIG